MKPTLIVTGSSGFVGSELIPLLQDFFIIIGIDRRAGASTTIVADISGISSFESMIPAQGFYVLHLAAARFDYGACAIDYYNANVSETERFLAWLGSKRVFGFVHVSSVAAFDGEDIEFREGLGCDDAYRSTKFLQGERVKSWARECGVPLHLLYPSAIFNDHYRSDTNIGKLQFLVNLLPILVKIPSRKSLTYLPEFSKFVMRCLLSEVHAGEYLTIERPVLSVAEILAGLSRRTAIQITVPFLYPMLIVLSYVLWGLVGGRVDMKITPNRVNKLFSNTDYETVPSGVDCEVYNSGHANTHEILKFVGEAKLRND